MIIGYEHTPPQVPLNVVIRGFEILAKNVMNLNITSRIEHSRIGLIHSVHQQLTVFAYEVLGYRNE